MGKLPPIVDRLPVTPLTISFEGTRKTVGRYGGTLRTLGGQSKDTRLLVVYGYARLVGYSDTFELKADLAQRVDIVEGRTFTFHLRKGHRWSDGEPFTSEDFRYYWQDVASNTELSAFGIPRALMVDGERPTVDIIDDTTVRYSWSKPNPFFLPALAAAQPLYIYRPAHYLKAFHTDYTDAAKLQDMVKASGQRNWVALHYNHDRAYRNDNVDAPTLQPWVLKTKPPADRFEFVRNPYFHRIDQVGHQLPYIDRVAMTIASSKLIPAKAGSGEVDLQSRNLNFSNYTFLKQGEKRNNFTVRGWTSSRGAKIALYPNLNVKDDVWRALVRKPNFRRAISMSINRHDINLAVFYGLAIEGNNTVLPGSPLFKPHYRNQWTEYAPDKANALLDALGLDQRNDNGIRLLPDGREAVIIVETAGEDTEQTDVLGLIREDWQKIGLKLLIKPMQREVFRRRIFSGTTLMSVWSGIENALPNAALSPAEFAPTSQQQLQWPSWGLNFETNMRMGEEPDIPAAKELLVLNQAWNETRDLKQQQKIWQRMLDIQTEQMFTIGLVAGVSQLVVVNNRLHNVPNKAVYSWKPGALFGVHRPDTFWFSAPLSATTQSPVDVGKTRP
ncbi:MAG: ABC transporter substrate-binding protein [Magnetovibrio sp.]|nr:ABC transporter substrate-binding protein [Magnetovibrio sp.]